MRTIYIAVIAALLMIPALKLSAEKKSLNIMSSVKEGRYNEKELLSKGKIPLLPIPNTKEDYAILQSIDKTTNIVLGQFKAGEKVIIFISDKNGDGKVDSVISYFPELKKFSNSTKALSEYTDEKFKKMKQDIINGVREEYFPNPEGTAFIKKSIEGRSNLVKKVKFKNGYKVYIDDADDTTHHRAMFYFSKSGNLTGANLAFEVRYHNVGSQMISPAINYSVYCKDSTDPVVADVASELVAFTKKYFGE